MASGTPPDAQFVERVRASFRRQQVMQLLGATLTSITPGHVEITLPFRGDLTQQHGFLHAGIVTAICDSACGYAALSLMPPQTGVLSIEYKVNLLAPARGDRFLARGRVLRAGRTIVVCAGDVYAQATALASEEILVATMLATMAVIRDRPDVSD
ncbi:MAG TPA: PaaI family thioesterase [Chloroflexia bacterium]|nr:PaaI family thioesterase [Chloroflexia bacterium]